MADSTTCRVSKCNTNRTPSVMPENRDIKPILENVMQLMQTRFQVSLKAQGHVNRGNLSDSIKYTVEVSDLLGIGKMEIADYGIYVNVGVKAERINYPIQVMIDWWQDRGLSEREATSAAWATRAVHKREGMPTRASARFSDTGERLGFVEAAVEQSLEEIGALIENQYGSLIELNFSEYFNRDKIRFEG